jgi:peptide-methionine (S)-S-oxide reductase
MGCRRFIETFALLPVLVLATLLVTPTAHAGQPATVVPAPSLDVAEASGAEQTAVLAGGCFWGMQGVFEHLSGVHRVLAGYAGGTPSTAHYALVGTGMTGHAESVQITYDPKVVSYGQVLQVFFSVAHDPTQLDAQSPDVGSQYRSEIFFLDDMQRQIATAYIAQLTKTGVFRAPIATRVRAFTGFFPAEDYHQDFLLHHPDNPYIAYNDLPKIQNFQKLLPALYRSPPVALALASR